MRLSKKFMSLKDQDRLDISLYFYLKPKTLNIVINLLKTRILSLVFDKYFFTTSEIPFN